MTSELYKKTSDLSRTATITDDNLLFFSNRDINFIYDESNQIKFSTMIRKIKWDIQNCGLFGTMISENESNYSRRGHLHDYTRCRVRSYCDYSDSGQLTNMLGEMVLTDGGEDSVVSVWIPNTVFDMEDKHSIGEVRFLDSTVCGTMEAILDSIQYGGFSGWVYADGRQYEKKQGMYDFSQAYERMEQVSKTVFRVPCLSSFFRANSTQKKNSIEEICGENVIPKHSHTLEHGTYEVSVVNPKIENIGVVFDSTSTQDSKQEASGYLYATTNVSKGNDQYEVDDFVLEFKTGHRDDKSVRTLQKNQVEDREQYPTHVKLLPLVWIGKVRR